MSFSPYQFVETKAIRFTKTELVQRLQTNNKIEEYNQHGR
jgi:hypothetical protein